MEQVFAVENVEEAIENLKARNEPWAQMALQNMGGLCVWSAPSCGGGGEVRSMHVLDTSHFRDIGPVT